MSELKDQEFLDFLIKAIVNNPDKVKLERKVDEMGVLFTLEVDPSDMPYVIGRQGRTAQAVRTLLKTVGSKNNSRVNLKIVEPEGSQRGMNRKPESSTPTPAPEKPPEDIDTSAVDGVMNI